jgi:ubiquinone/menaquinone biosynthesis C-methylase UbiE
MKKDPYSFHARIYDRLYEPAAHRLRKIGLTLYPPQANLSVLDVGCGTGTQLALYQRPGCSLAGIDLSPAMLAVARRKLGAAAELHAGDASQMPFPEAVFDLVTIVLVLHEMPPMLRPAVLQECRRVVKPGGRIMLMDYHCGPYPLLSGWLWKMAVMAMELSAGSRHFANYCDFIARRGLEGLISRQQLAIDRKYIAESGVAAVYVVAMPSGRGLPEIAPQQMGEKLFTRSASRACASGSC